GASDGYSCDESRTRERAKSWSQRRDWFFLVPSKMATAVPAVKFTCSDRLAYTRSLVMHLTLALQCECTAHLPRIASSANPEAWEKSFFRLAVVSPLRRLI